MESGKLPHFEVQTIIRIFKKNVAYSI